jgi:hypothetical protein
VSEVARHAARDEDEAIARLGLDDAVGPPERDGAGPWTVGSDLGHDVGDVAGSWAGALGGIGGADGERDPAVRSKRGIAGRASRRSVTHDFRDAILASQASMLSRAVR